MVFWWIHVDREGRAVYLARLPESTIVELPAPFSDGQGQPATMR